MCISRPSGSPKTVGIEHPGMHEVLPAGWDNQSGSRACKIYWVADEETRQRSESKRYHCPESAWRGQ